MAPTPQDSQHVTEGQNFKTNKQWKHELTPDPLGKHTKGRI